MSYLRNVVCVAWTTLLLVGVGTVQAQQPSLGYVYPPSIRAGSTAEVQLGGYDFTPDLEFFVHHEGVKLTSLGGPGDFFVPEPPYWFGQRGFSAAFPLPREIPAKIEVPADTPPGLVRWQVANANGASATAVFYVSERDEVVEVRHRDSDIQRLPTLPTAVSGRVRKISEVDRYEFTPDKDGPITIDLMARRLGANFNGVVQVRDSNGQMVADVADTAGLDTTFTFAGRAGEPYTASVFDADFRGNRAFVYRLAITRGPRVVATIPAAGRHGETREVELVGYGVATGKPEIESTRKMVTFLAGSDVASIDTAAVGHSIRLSDIPEKAENDIPDEPLTAPCAVTGTLEVDSVVDRYSWSSVAGETWRIDVQSSSLGTTLDVSLDIEDASGKVIATNDDLPGTLDAGIDFKAPADGKYVCVIRDGSGQAGSRASVYRLSLLRQTPDFELTTDQKLLLPVAGKAQLSVKVARKAGFNGEIALQVEGLPDGVTVPDELTIPEGKNELKVAFEAAESSATSAALIRVVGTATIGEAEVTRVATTPAGGNLCPRDPAENRLEAVLLARTMKAPVAVQLVDKNRQRAVHRGTTYPAPFIIKRDEGFDGEVTLMMAAAQGRHRQGISAPIMTVAPGVTEAAYPCFMPEWLATDRTTRMAVLGMVKVADAAGKDRYLTAAADARITMILEGALLKVSHRASELTVALGESFEIPVDILRSAKLSEDVRVELEVPRQLAGVVTAEPVDLPLERTSAMLRVNVKPNASLSGDWTFQVKATAMQDGRWLVKSLADVPVRFSTVTQ